MEEMEIRGIGIIKDTSILAVDPSRLIRRLVADTLKKKFTVDTVASGKEALEHIDESRPDLILMSLHLGDMEGMELFSRIKSRGEGMNEVPVIFLTSDGDIGTESMLFKAGAMDYIRKPFEPEVLSARVGHIVELDKLRRSYSLKADSLSSPAQVRGKKNDALSKRLVNYQNDMVKLFHETMFDELTGTSNRFGLRMAFENMMANPERGPYALVISNLDNLGHINETYGHVTGDRYVLEFSQVLISVTDGKAFRYGGDEFCLIFTGVDEEKLFEICSDIQKMFSVSKACQEFEEITASFGACFWDGTMTPSELMGSADIALYNAKKTMGCLRIYNDRFR